MTDELTASDLDLTDTAFEGCSPRLIDSNGTKFLVGEDAHGWFSIIEVVLMNEQRDGTIAIERKMEYPVSFTPDSGVQELRAALEEFDD